MATPTTSAMDITELVRGHWHRSPDQRAAALRDFAPEHATGRAEDLARFLLAVAEDPAERLPVGVAALELLAALPFQQATDGSEATRRHLFGLLTKATSPQLRTAAGCALPAVPGIECELLRLRRLLDDEPDKAVRRKVGAVLSDHLAAVVTARAAEIATDAGATAALRRVARSVRTIRVRAPRDLQKVTRLAYACEEADRIDDARLVASAALGVLFSDDYGIWSPVESALALLWLYAEPADRPTVRQILDVGTALPDVAQEPLARRLADGLLYSEKIGAALNEGDQKTAADWTRIQLRELTLLLAYGGSAVWPVERLTEKRAADLALLRAGRY
jgi:hypothetical protein